MKKETSALGQATFCNWNTLSERAV